MTKTIVITGASDGIGAAAARQLAVNGHKVIIVGRSRAKTAAIASELRVDSYVADFANFQEVRALAADLLEAYRHIDVLANNAGGVFGDPTKTVDGFERTMQINHLSPFLLTNLLLGTLITSGASVIQTSSAGARLAGNIDINDLENDKKFSPGKAYGDAKLANILFTQELHRRYHLAGLSSAAFHPGGVATNLASDSPSPMRFLYKNRFARRLLTTPDEGARQLVWLAEGTPDVGWQSGAYYEKGKPATKVNPQTTQVDLAEKLWEKSELLTGLNLERRH